MKPEVLKSWSLEIDYSRAPCLGADQKARGLWEQDWESKIFGIHSGEAIFSLVMVWTTVRELPYFSKRNLIMKLRYSERTSKGDSLS